MPLIGDGDGEHGSDGGVGSYGREGAGGVAEVDLRVGGEVAAEGRDCEGEVGPRVVG